MANSYFMKKDSLSALLKAGFNQSEVAMEWKRHKSIISREVSRNIGLAGYRPQQAQCLPGKRSQSGIRPRITDMVWTSIEPRLRENWIYLPVLQDNFFGETLYSELHCRKQRRKRSGSDRVSVHEQPAVVEKYSGLGGWELDTIIGKHYRQPIVSPTRLKCLVTLIYQVERKAAPFFSRAMVKLLRSFSGKVATVNQAMATSLLTTNRPLANSSFSLHIPTLHGAGA